MDDLLEFLVRPSFLCFLAVVDEGRLATVKRASRDQCSFLLIRSNLCRSVSAYLPTYVTYTVLDATHRSPILFDGIVFFPRPIVAGMPPGSRGLDCPIIEVPVRLKLPKELHHANKMDT